MSSLAYKCVRRVVNVLALLLAVEALVVIGYSFWSKTLSRIEIYALTSEMGFSSVINHLVSFSLFMAMVSSTAVNSKSKFTINIAIIFGLFFFVFSLGCFIYVKVSYGNKMKDSIYFLSTKNPNNISTIISMISTSELIVPNMENEMEYILRTIEKELSILQIILTCTFTITGVMTIFMILGHNCKISKPKKVVEEEEVEIITRTVGFPGKSLRKNRTASASE